MSPCQDYTTAPPSTRSTTTRFLNNIDCNFDCNCTCSWIDDPTSVFKWTVWKGATPTQLTGPTADHTTESDNGYYIFMNAAARNKNDSARIVSNYLDVSLTNGGCLKFFYHMFGADVSRFSIYQQFANNTVFGNYGKAVWQKIGSQGNEWRYGQVFVGGSSLYRARFIFEGIVMQQSSNY